MRIQTGLLWVFGLTLISASVFNEYSPEPYIFRELDRFPEMPLSDENPVTVEGADLGRHLFYDSILSSDYSVSCASCHKQRFAFSDNRQFSLGVNNALSKRNSMPLFNLAWGEAFFWDGKAASIEEQVFFPVRDHSEMNLDWKVAEKRIRENKFYRKKFRKAFGRKEIDSLLIAKAIAQFERTLISADSKFDKALRGEVFLTAEEYDGFVIMNDQSMGDCLHCHITDANALGTTGKFSNNGLQKADGPSEFSDLGRFTQTGKDEDVGRFKIPSLRNIALTAPYMHDGRFQTLEEVIDFYSFEVNASYNVDSKMTRAHYRGVALTPEEKANVISFLHTLTDSSFIQNPAFQNPWKN